jgi:hypothetical protein
MSRILASSQSENGWCVQRNGLKLNGLNVVEPHMHACILQQRMINLFWQVVSGMMAS